MILLPENTYSHLIDNLLVPHLITLKNLTRTITQPEYRVLSEKTLPNALEFDRGLKFT